jgi:hypothetical protein
MSQSRVVCVWITLWDGRSRVRIPVAARDFSFLQNVGIGSVPPFPRRLLQFHWYRDSFQVVKRPRREVNHSPSSSHELKNERITSSPSLWLHGVDKENLKLLHLTVRDNDAVCMCMCMCVCGGVYPSLHFLNQWRKSLLIQWCQFWICFTLQVQMDASFIAKAVTAIRKLKYRYRTQL